jgi:hypothetical protein
MYLLATLTINDLFLLSQQIRDRKIALSLYQFLMAANCFPIFFVYTSLYVFLVTIACSQLEKLTASLLDIRQTPDIPEKDSCADTANKQEQGHVYATQRTFCRMQKQLNYCIHHHQEILRCVTKMPG